MREELFGADSEGEEEEIEQQPGVEEPADAYLAPQVQVGKVIKSVLSSKLVDGSATTESC